MCRALEPPEHDHSDAAVLALLGKGRINLFSWVRPVKDVGTLDPATPLSVTLLRSDWLLLEQILVAQYRASWHDRLLAIVGIIGRARVQQVLEVRRAPDAVHPRTDAQREYDRRRKVQKREAVR
jgi:hypothetical protein